MILLLIVAFFSHDDSQSQPRKLQQKSWHCFDIEILVNL